MLDYESKTKHKYIFKMTHNFFHFGLRYPNKWLLPLLINPSNERMFIRINDHNDSKLHKRSIMTISIAPSRKTFYRNLSYYNCMAFLEFVQARILRLLKQCTESYIEIKSDYIYNV